MSDISSFYICNKCGYKVADNTNYYGGCGFCKEGKMVPYPIHWSTTETFPKDLFDKAKELTEGVEVDLDKPLEDNEPKYTIIKDERSCFGPEWCLNGKWLEEGEYLEQNEELIEHILNVLRDRIKQNNIMVDDLLYCIHYDDWEEDKGGSCETCGHHGGGKTTWKI